MTDRIDGWRKRSQLGLTILYGTAGALHILMPKPFLGITPLWVPAPTDVIFLTGVCEILGAAGLQIPVLRKYAGIGLALYAICVYPANLKHALDTFNGPSVSEVQWIYHLGRLPLQPVLVWLALFAAKLVTWPWMRSAR
jgi:uncharacterized membrane protein